nr:PREDICTED: spindle and kinetochore-associated protein 3 isoform X2 [Latimeria chalumnae]|eukprot:XP_014348044.1 PREDICTED: spindle and kinetochore-associated protein 3 isoform X2 [Latimeria chalumnae]
MEHVQSPQLHVEMEATANFFNKLRVLADSLEKETKHLEQAFNNRDEDACEDEAPMRVLHEMHSDISTLKASVRTHLSNMQAEKNEIKEFVKACSLLKQRTMADLEQIEEYFQKYGYEPLIKKSTESVPEMQEEKAKNHEPNTGEEENPLHSEENQKDKPKASTPSEKPPLPRDPLRTPQLSDFGLSQYQFCNPWNIAEVLPPLPKFTQKTVGKAVLKTPTFKQIDRAMPKTPKCMLKMDDESLALKQENSGINEYSMCLNDDFTIALINKYAQKSMPKSSAQGVGDQMNDDLSKISSDVGSTPASVTHEIGNASCVLHSPLPPMFCTPGLKVHKKEDTVLAKTPEKSELSTVNGTATPVLPNFETPWLKKNCGHMQLESKENTAKLSSEESAPLVLSSDTFLDKPSLPPRMTASDNLLLTPEPPVMMTTQISKDVFKVLSQFNLNSQKPPGMQVENKTSSAPAFVNSVSKNKADKENRSRLLAVSENEFYALPDYLRRQIPLAVVNNSIQKINMLLEKKLSGSKLDPLIGEQELRSVLEVGPHIRALLLSLIELNRVEPLETPGNEEMYRALLTS